MKLTNVVPKIRLKKKFVDGTKQSIVSRKRMKIVSFIKHDLVSEWKLEVIYAPSITNSGTFESMEDTLQSLTDWTSKDQIDFVEDGEWD